MHMHTRNANVWAEPNSLRNVYTKRISAPTALRRLRWYFLHEVLHQSQLPAELLPQSVKSLGHLVHLVQLFVRGNLGSCGILRLLYELRQFLVLLLQLLPRAGSLLIQLRAIPMVAICNPHADIQTKLA